MPVANSFDVTFLLSSRSLAVSLAEDLVKPLKSAVESQYRVRKAVESGVDKTGRLLAEWRSAQAKAKKHCYLTARDNEKVQDQLYTTTGQAGGGNGSGNNRQAQQRTLTEKELAKLEAKCRKTQESLRKVSRKFSARLSRKCRIPVD